jgi:hypothetical protein
MNRQEKIQPNYIIDEFIRIFGVPGATEINYADIKPEHINTIKTKTAPFTQTLRNEINEKFGQENGKEIGLRVICGFRARRWDIMQGRSGDGEHPKATAVDVVPINCKDDDMFLKVFYYIAMRCSQHNGGFAIKFPTFNAGKIATFGFIHIDFRSGKARWNY